MSNTIQSIQKLIKREANRQQQGLVMIASENYASPEILSAMGSSLSNKYSEGYPGKRYYTGNEVIDQIEHIAQEEALKLFKLGSKKWHANVQPHSGSSANLAVYTALLKTGDAILAMDLSAGGHLTHGSPASITGKLYNFSHYGVDPKTCALDYDAIAQLAQKYQPKLIVCGATAYPRTINFKKFATIAKSCGALLLADISHIAGLISAGQHPSPFPYADIVTTTTHKTLSGPRSAIIICKQEFTPAINRAVFPGLQGGPLENMIAAKAICFIKAQQPKFKKIQAQTVANTRALAGILQKQNITIVAGGSDNHLLLVDCRKYNINGATAADALAHAHIYTNANMVPFDTGSAREPSGIRIGTAALSTRGMKEREMRMIGLWIAEIIKNSSDTKLQSRIKKIVTELTSHFPIHTS
jgi:glycine hydroxymethyltransferase